jgi:hypothetical protein
MSTSIRSIVEDRVTAYLANQITGVTINKGVTNEIRTLPIIIAHAEGAIKPTSLGALNLGNYRVNLKVYIYSSADDETLEAHRERVSKVHGLLTDSDALKAFWGSDYGQLYEIWIENDEEGMSQRRYGNALSFTLMCVLPPQV